MKTKKKKYLPLYEKWMKNGEISEGWTKWGLCNALSYENKGQYDDFFYIMEPTENDLQELKNEGLSDIYWGSGLPSIHKDKHRGFTTLRQTIVLFLAALNNEL